MRILALFIYFLILFGIIYSVEAQEMDKHTANKIVDAIYIAEGGEKAKKPYGILSVPCDSKESCRKICYNTVVNNYHRWLKSDQKIPYIDFLANRYCPIGAENDPKGLNKNWKKNVLLAMGPLTLPRK